MILSAKGQFGFSSEPFLVLLQEGGGVGGLFGKNISQGGPALIRLSTQEIGADLATDTILIPSELGYLQSGDIVRLTPHFSEIRVLFRRSSKHNSLFITERCNSRCIMCSQPPRKLDDDYLADDILTMLPWVAKSTEELGITGGEPTLLGTRLTEVIRSAKNHLPSTALHMLSNGRRFADLRYAEEIAEVSHPDLMIGIPIYSDISADHDFIVQAVGAFTETILGILNLARVGVRVELRIVIHRETVSALPRLARFIARNLPFVEQVAFMALEPTGFARTNIRALWIDPYDYQAELQDAVDNIRFAGIAPRIYNHQLCVLSSSIRQFAVRSISDWKNIYLPVCEACSQRAKCGGFFQSSVNQHFTHLHPF